MKRVIIRSVRNDRIIKIWQIEIRISASAKKPKLFISGRTQNPTEKNQTEEEKMMRLIKKQRNPLYIYFGKPMSPSDYDSADDMTTELEKQIKNLLLKCNNADKE